MNKKSKIILFFPKIFPYEVHNEKQWNILPLSLLMLASPLEKADYIVDIIDQRIDPDWKDQIATSIDEFNVLMVGISVMTGYPIKGALDCSMFVKELDSDVKIVWGGVHPTLMPDQTLESIFVDIVGIGEGENTLVELARSLENGESLSQIKGIYYKENNEIMRNPPAKPVDLEDSLLPAYHLVDLERYFSSPWENDKSIRPLAFLTSKGCTWRCSYCYNLTFNQRKWRSSSPRKVVDEMGFLINRFDLDSFFLLDDNFFVKKERALSICEKIIEKKLNIQLLNVNCRADILSKYSVEELTLLNKAGIASIFIGVESGSDTVLETIKKDLKVEQTKAVNKQLAQAEITPIYSFMIGFPEESMDDIKKTLKLMSQLSRENPSAIVNQANLFTPFPGTPLYDHCLDLGMTFPKTLVDWISFDYRFLNFRELLSDDMNNFQQEAVILSGFIDKKIITKGNLLSLNLKKMYSHIANWRINNDIYKMMPEITWLRKKLELMEEKVRGDN